jgi:hypothetical protein
MESEYKEGFKCGLVYWQTLYFLFYFKTLGLEKDIQRMKSIGSVYFFVNRLI